MKKNTFRFDELRDIAKSSSGLVTFGVWSERENQTQQFQVPFYLDIYTFMRAAYGLDKTNYSFTPNLDKTVSVRSGTQMFTLSYS